MPLQFLNDFFAWIVNWFPHISLMQVNYGGIKFLPGGKTEVIEPGMYVYWPVTTTIEEISIRRRGVSIIQRLTTKDNVRVLVETSVIFLVNDVYLAIVETFDFDDTILEMAQEAVIAPVQSRDFVEVVNSMTDETMRKQLTPKVRTALKQFGVYVEKAFISDFTETNVICHEGSGLSINTEED